MKRVALMFLALVVSVSISGLAFAENLKKGDVVYAKYSIRGKGKEIFWHNMSSMPVLVPVGTELKVLDVAAGQVKLGKSGEQSTIWMVADTKQWDKYFVSNKNDVKMVEKTEIAEGMSKEEVYLVKGCPSFIALGVKSYFKSMADIMASDTWYYNANTKSVGVLVKFSNGKVESSDAYKKSRKKK